MAKVPPEASSCGVLRGRVLKWPRWSSSSGSFLACGVLREVCKGVVVAFKTNPEWIRGSSVGGDSKGENTVSYVVGSALKLEHRSNGD